MSLALVDLVHVYYLVVFIFYFFKSLELCILSLSLSLSRFRTAFSTPHANPEFEGHGGDEYATELANIAENAILPRLDLRELCILKGQQCWALNIDALVGHEPLFAPTLIRNIWLVLREISFSPFPHIAFTRCFFVICLEPH